MNPSQISYAQEENEQPFDWFHFLSTPHTLEEWHDAYQAAASWVSCACGNQCARIPRRSSGEPYDPELASLGNLFCRVISQQEAGVCEALELLARIEVRSATILAEIDWFE